LETTNAELEDAVGGIKLASGQITKGTRSSRTLRRRNAVMAASFELKGKRVLDVGCAEGLHALYMSGNAKEVWGIDHRRSSIATAKATARALNIENVRFEVGDVRDPDLFKGYGTFDLAIAWGVLHRVSDIFSLLYTLAPLTNAISLEWRTPVFPLMSVLSMAYHPPGGSALDPMNLVQPGKAARDKDKVEGDVAFWEPTVGAVIAITSRLGFGYSKVLGFGEKLESENEVLASTWQRHQGKLLAGKAQPNTLPRARVHLLLEKSKNSIALKDVETAARALPTWDVALHEAIKRKGL
jgi:SAM-dependent methyltransferase